MGPFATHRLLVRIALSAAHIFAWLFIFQYFYYISDAYVPALVSTVVSYALAQILATMLTPLTAARLRKGIRGLLVNALLALSAAFAVLSAAFSGSLGSIQLGIVAFALCMGIYRAFYWIPYELVSKKFSISSTSEILLALTPAVAGYLISLTPSAPVYVLAIASIISLSAIIPVYAFRNMHEGFSWGYRETFHHLFTRSHRIPLLQAVCNGFEGATLLLLWPVAMFVLLDWSYFAVGLVLSATYMCTIVASMFMHPVHKRIQGPVMRSVLTASGWLLRGTVAAPFTIVLVDTYYQSGSGISQRGVDVITAEQAADSNSYIDEFTALKDMGQGIGRILFCVLIVLFAGAFTFATIAILMFCIAALVAVFSIMVSRSSAKSAY